MLRTAWRRLPGALVAGVLVLAACQPDSITAARDQLGRAPERTLDVILPITRDTVTIDEFVDDSIVQTPSGAAGVLLDPESTTVAVGSGLRFAAVSLDPFAFSYDQMLVTASAAGGVLLPSTPSTTFPFATPEGSGVTSATVATGLAVRTVVNTSGCDATVTTTLTDGDGDLAGTFVPTLVANGVTLTDTIPLDGAVIDSGLTVTGGATFGACAPAADVGVSVTVPPLALASVDLRNLSETFSAVYAPLASEDRLLAVDTVEASGGTLDLTVENRLPIAVTVDVTLDGVLIGGFPPTRSVLVPAAPGDGSLVGAQTTIDLAGATLLPGAVQGVVNGVAVAGTATVTPALTVDAIRVSGGGDIDVARLAGALDPGRTPELTVAVENNEEIDRAGVDFGDFEDAVRAATLNEATITLHLTNEAAAPAELTGFTVGLVELDATGAVPRDTAGNPRYETDGTGAPLVVGVTDPGAPTLPLARNGSATVLLDAPALVDRMVSLILDDRRAAVVAAGSTIVGDGQPAAIAAGDGVRVRFEVTVGLDITLPDSGATVTRNTVFDGLGFETADADQIEARLLDAAVTSAVLNGMPYAVTVDIAFIEGDRGEVDVFTLPGHVAVAAVSVAAPTVDPTGRATALAADSVALALTGTDVRALLGDQVTATVRVRIQPAATGGRAVLRPADPVTVDARVRVRLRGGTP